MKYYYTLFLLLPVFLFSCTDSEIDDGADTPMADTLFNNVEAGIFTGVYDTSGYTFLVNTITKEMFEAAKSSVIMEDSVKNKICPDSTGCMERMEAYAISKYPTKVKRSKSSLILSLGNGKTVELKNTLTEDDNYEVYQFLTIDEVGNYILAVYYFESYAYYIVNGYNGKSTRTIGEPKLSPNKQRYLAGNYDMVAAFTFNGLEFLTIAKDSVFSNLMVDFGTWGPEEIRWRDDSTVYVKQKAFPGEGKELTNYGAVRIRSSGSL